MRIILLIVCFAVSETISARVERSYGGERISINDAPYIVSIKKNGEHKCCGALITWQHVLTAASCIVDERDKLHFDLIVATGTHSKFSWGYQRAIKKVSLHYRFMTENRNSYYDITVLTLSELLPEDNEHHPILFANAPPDEFAIGLFITFDQKIQKRFNGYLTKSPVVINYLSQSTTNQAGDDPKYFSAFEGIMKDGYSSDVEDTGGPLVYNNTVIGIASEMLTIQSRIFINVAACADFISQALSEK